MIASRKMKVAVFALLLVLTVGFALVVLPAVVAHDPPLEIPTWVYVAASPNPVGVNQTVTFTFWNTMPPPAATATDNVRWSFTLTVERPNGNKRSLGTFISDVSGKAYATYAPDEVGNWSVTVDFPQTVYTWNDTAAQLEWTGDTFLASFSTAAFVVQEEPVSDVASPMPEWYTSTSNWLGSGSPRHSGLQRKHQPEGEGPNTPHIMWTKPLESGGVVGGTNVGVEGNTFYMGLTYNRRFGAQFILDGKLYYRESSGNSGSGGGFIIVDLRTGEELLRTTVTSLSFAYVQGSIHIFFGSSTFGTARDPLTLEEIGFSLTGIPSGTWIPGPSGEHLRVGIYNAGTTADPEWRLRQWNSSKAVTPEAVKARETIDASGAEMLDFDVPIPYYPENLTGSSSPTIIDAGYDNAIIGRSSTFIGSISPTQWGTPDPYTFWAISLKPESRGELMWVRNYTAPPNENTLLLGPVDFVNNFFTLWNKEEMKYLIYSIDTGDLIRETERTLSDFDYYEPETTAMAFDGKLFYANYGGITYCWDGKTGDLLWTYGNGGPGNTTYTGFGTSWGHWPIQPEVACKGKLYLTSTEHSPNTPLYKNAQLICLDTDTGEELWRISNYGGTYGGFGPQACIADGYLITFNHYDHQIYCYGKGPSATTVAVSSETLAQGSSVMIKGTVLDLTAGTEQHEQAARFPNGLACVSDENMTEWMEYVYMHRPRPDVVGVEVVLKAIGLSGVVYDIENVTSDSTGVFGYVWTPDAAGEYVVVAEFAGSEAYLPSSAEVVVSVEAAPEPTPTPMPTAAPMTEMYVLGSTIGIIVTIAVVTVVIVLLIRRRQ